MGSTRASRASLYLSIEDIDQPKVKAKSPQTNEEMQKDIDQWMELYNNERAHSGRYCYGKTPMQTFIDSKELAKAKDVNNLFGQINTFKLPDQAEVGSA